jgi:pimeloyl-ACP methyl ester carboxylesterase
MRGLALALILSVARLAGAQDPRTFFITVEKDVRLEVLDWGGSGRPVMLLAGRGQTAHSFASFAPSLAEFYHVYSVTRRGYGASSKPATGYLADRLADDVLAVIDSLHLTKPAVAGHSLAGQELSSLGSRHADRVAGLIYLDAGYAYAFYDSTRGNIHLDVAVLKQRLERLQAAGNVGDLATMDTIFKGLLDQDLPSVRRDLTVMQSMLGHFKPSTTLGPPVQTGIEGAIDDGGQRYTKIRGPVLAIYALANPPAGVGTDPQVTQRWIAQDQGAIGVFARGVPQSEVVILPYANHFVFNSNPTEVLAQMRAFIDRLPR